MEFYDEKIKQLAIEIYELDAEVFLRLREIYVSEI